MPSGAQNRAAIFGSFRLTETKILDRLPDGAGFITLLMMRYGFHILSVFDMFHLILPGGTGFLVSRVSIHKLCFLLLKQRFQM
jgi:hypothetical protein